MKVIVADSSTLITLLDTHNFDLLFGLFGQLIITREVYKEITFSGDHQVIIDEHITTSGDEAKLKHYFLRECCRLVLRYEAQQSTNPII